MPSFAPRMRPLTKTMWQPSAWTRLGLLSSDLDKLAAQVDGVVSEGSTVLKERKKVLSKRLVQLMERVDVLIAFFRKGRDSSNQETVSQ